VYRRLLAGSGTREEKVEVEVTLFPQFLKLAGTARVFWFVRERRRRPYLWESHGEDERRARL
jgi:hypothetical protein